MSDRVQEREELTGDEAGSTAPGQPRAKTSSGDAESITGDGDDGDADS